MKKYILPIILLMMLTFISRAQTFWDDVTISAQFAAAHHDKRLIGFSESSKQEYLERTPETWGTWQYGVINRKLIRLAGVSVDLGIGYALEDLNFFRIVDHCFDKPTEPCSAVIVHSDNYHIHELYSTLNFNMKVYQNLSVDLDLMPFFSFQKILLSKDDMVIKKKSEFKFYTFEVNPGLNYVWNKFRFGLNYRLWQVKKIDRVLLADRTIPSGGNDDSILTNTYEHYNPVKLWFSMGYRLGE